MLFLHGFFLAKLMAQKKPAKTSRALHLFFGNGSRHGWHWQAFSLKDARPNGIGLLRSYGVAQRLQAWDPGLCRGGVYSAKQERAKSVPTNSVTQRGNTNLAKEVSFDFWEFGSF